MKRVECARVLLRLVVMIAFGLLEPLSDSVLEVEAAPPLSLKGFLDEKLPEADPNAPKIKVDNGACYVCHGNFEEDSLVLRHGQEEIGCIDCHGESLAHRNDEDNVTPPDEMYGSHDIDTMCRECHETHDASPRRVLKRWQQRCPAKTNPKDIVCTDCHFHHRLNFRTVWWDKKTGALIIRKDGERTKPAVDLKKESATQSNGSKSNE